MEELAEKLVEWNLHPEIIVPHRFPIEEAKEAYDLFDMGLSGKVALVWD